MLTVVKISCIAILFLMGAGVCRRTSAYAQDAAWRVDKSWGDFWINAQIVRRNGNPTFGPGDSLRTGQNGGVVLVRGKESIVISPNTEAAISKKSVDEMSTTINQRTGSITIQVEPNDMKYFEVKTPFLAAVAKGSNLRVAIEDNYARVHAFRGEVEVSDFRAGQRVLVMAGQTAETSTHAMAGLSLSGAGEFAEIRQDTPRHSRVEPLTLSPLALSTAVQAPTAEQTSRPGQTHGAGQEYGAGQTDARETKAPIKKIVASSRSNADARETKDAIKKIVAVAGQTVDAGDTKEAIKKFVAAPEQTVDAGDTKEEIKNFFALAKNSVSAQDARPVGSIEHIGNQGASQNSDLLLSWAIPIGIGVLVTFAAKIFGQKRQTDDRPLDYNY